MKTETGLVKKNFFEDPPPEIPGPLNPHPLEFPIPSVGGGVWIFSGTTQCN